MSVAENSGCAYSKRGRD